MHYIKRIEVKGLWDEEDFVFTLSPAQNFIIGVNGTGKTTIIKLLVAALNGDVETLNEIPFASVTIYFHPVDKKRIAVKRLPLLQIIKDSDPYSFNDYLFFLQPFLDEDEYFVTFETDENDEIILVENEKIDLARLNTTNEAAEMFADSLYDQIISNLIDIVWLPIHRNNEYETIRKETTIHKRGFPTFQVTNSDKNLNKKLSDTLSRLSEFFSELDYNSSLVIEEFQREFFLNTLVSFDEKAFSIYSFDQKFDIDNERNILNEILENFAIPNDKYSKKLSAYFKKIEASRKILSSEKLPDEIYVNDYAILLLAQRNHQTVIKWNETIKKRDKIFDDRNKYIKLLNKLLRRKSVSISSGNKLLIKTNKKSSQNLRIRDLSSGEKQLFILLSEALLSKGKSISYIADEPELSLHISWQRILVDSLKEINPNSQIIFATHSPDIVAKYNDNIIDIENSISK